VDTRLCKLERQLRWLKAYAVLSMAMFTALIFVAARNPTKTVKFDEIDAHKINIVEANGKAIRYGVGVGDEAFKWSGIAEVGAKKEWPGWLPPADMIARWPHLKPVVDAGGLKGGPDNPLGARALYLFQDNKDTLYRIHGTNEPESIGHAVSSGCIRMRNIDVIDLYQRVPLGARVVVK